MTLSLSGDTSVSTVCHVQLLLLTVYLLEATLLPDVLSQYCMDRTDSEEEEQEEDMMLCLKLNQDADNCTPPSPHHHHHCHQTNSATAASTKISPSDSVTFPASAGLCRT